MSYFEYRPTQTLYQYCSWESLAAIIESKRLRFTDLAGANDPREIHLGLKHFIDALQSVREADYPGDKGRFLDVFRDGLLRHQEGSEMFSACLSLNADSLPMWATYGANHCGVAIGFRPAGLANLPARCQKIRYLDERLRSDFTNLAREIARTLPENRDYDLFRSLSASASAWAAITALKHETWSYEREVRFVHAQTKEAMANNEGKIFSYTSILPDGTPVMRDDPQVRIANARSVRYLEYPFGKYSNKSFHPERAIELVVLGPNCAHDETDSKVLLEANGFRDFKIVKSDCMIR